MEGSTITVLSLLCILATVITLFLILRCWFQGKKCPTRCRIDGRTVLITDADTPVGIELARELSQRGARYIHDFFSHLKMAPINLKH